MAEIAHDPLSAAREALAARRFDAAVSSAENALAVAPKLLEAIEIRAQAQQECGDWDGAEQGLRDAIATAPEHYPPFELLARLLLIKGRGDEAEKIIRGALIAHPDHADAHALLGMRLSQRGQLIPGIWHLRRALELGPRRQALLTQLGHNLIRIGAADEAEPLLAEATANAPDGPEILLPLVYHARTLERLGRNEQAQSVLAHAKTIATALGQDISLQEALLIENSSDWREALAILEAAPALSGTALLMRGRLRDRAGRHEEAWSDYLSGKALKSRETGLIYDRAGVGAHITQLTRFFSDARMSTLPRAARRADVPQPLFIMGFPRSGTTMTEQLITSHSQVRAGDELPFTGELIEFVVTMTGSFPDGLAGLAAADRHHVVTLFRDFYLARAETYGLIKPGAAFFTDKMPLNEIYLPLLHLAFPHAKVVTVRRHPLDILVSVMGHNLTHGFNCGFALEDAAYHLAAMSDLLACWQRLGIDTLTFRYEDFIADPAKQTERLMAYLGLEMEDEQLRFHESKRLSPTPSYAQVREPLYDRSIGRWRNHAEGLAPIIDTVAAAMARDGYTV